MELQQILQTIMSNMQALQQQNEAMAQRITKLEKQVAKVAQQGGQDGSVKSTGPKRKAKSIIAYENRDASFEMFKPNFKGYDLSKLLATTKDLVNEFLTNPGRSKAIFIGGKAGIGKTTLGISCVKEFEARDKTVLLINANDVFKMYTIDNRNWHLIEEADLIILDDFNGATGGIESGFLTKFIPLVHEMGEKMVIVTSNLPFQILMKNSFPQASIQTDKDGNVIQRHEAALGNTERIERRIRELFDGRIFQFGL